MVMDEIMLVTDVVKLALEMVVVGEVWVLLRL